MGHKPTDQDLSSGPGDKSQLSKQKGFFILASEQILYICSIIIE